MGEVFRRIRERAAGCAAVENFSFAGHTAVGIGGGAPLCLRPQSVRAAVGAVQAVRQAGVPLAVLGAGANVLAADGGFDGAVLLTDGMRGLAADGEFVFAESGVRVSRLLRVSAQCGLGGFSFMAGIPASVGGAAYMNAGTALGHFGDRIISVSVLTADGKICELAQKECAFAYKSTWFMQSGALILSVRLRAEKQPPAAALREIGRVLASRRHLPKGRSMGCVFKNPEGGVSAGALIERAGMKGASEGGAFVAEEHANFIINGGNASAKDVRALIGRIRSAVLLDSGVRLSEEIVYIGED